ncbi:MAG TPA: ribulose-phosphate 3-epimerase [Actinomycetota bacterium]
MGVKIAPSILSADFARLADDVAGVRAESDLLHVDVMDNHYVPNLTIGPPVVRSLRQHTDLFLDCHLMVTDPGSLLEPLAEAGADGVTVHVELGDPRPLIARMRELGLQPALTMNPPTPFAAVEPYLELVDLLLVMSVHPGFGGQAFIPEVLPKVQAAQAAADRNGLRLDIQIDGGINPETAVLAARAGANVLVAGSAIFLQPDPPAAARRIREAAESALPSG